MTKLVGSSLTESVRISFELDAPSSILEREIKPRWYICSDGHFDITCGDRSIFSQDRSHEYQSSVPDGIAYYVARLWEDMCDILPIAIEVIPAQLALRITSDDWHEWVSRVSTCDDIDPAQVEAALTWWHSRHLDVSYLSPQTSIVFIRTSETLFLRWQNAALQWETARLAPQQMQQEVALFNLEFIRAMGDQIEACAGLVSAQLLEEMRSEHAARCSEGTTKLAIQSSTNWDSVFEAMRGIDAIVDAM